MTTRYLNSNACYTAKICPSVTMNIYQLFWTQHLFWMLKLNVCPLNTKFNASIIYDNGQRDNASSCALASRHWLSTESVKGINRHKQKMQNALFSRNQTFWLVLDNNVSEIYKSQSLSRFCMCNFNELHCRRLVSLTKLYKDRVNHSSSRKNGLQFILKQHKIATFYFKTSRVISKQPQVLTIPSFVNYKYM